MNALDRWLTEDVARLEQENAELLALLHEARTYVCFAPHDPHEECRRCALMDRIDRALQPKDE